VLFLIAGCLLLGLLAVDVVWTTLWPDGAAGPFASAVTTVSWRAVRRLGGSRSRIVSLSGPVSTLAVLGGWILLLWAGWVLVYSSDSASLVDTSGAGVSLAGRTYFVAYTIFTMGNGDFSPAGGVWQVATSLAAASGMVMITFAVTYVLSIVQTVAKRRSFASSVHGLGRTPVEFVRQAVNGDLSSLDLPLDDLAGQLSSLSEQHLAFPVLHYYHPARPRKATTVAVAVLDDAMTIVEHGLRDAYRNRPVLARARASIDDYLATLDGAFIAPAPEAPPLPDVADLRQDGFDVVSGEEFSAAAERLADRRRRLRGAVEADAWPWSTTQAGS
jgi:hypothetical protein